MPKELAPGLVAETVGDLLAPNDLVLVFDTETSGIPLWHQPSDHADQPHVIELAAELCAPDGRVIETYNQLVNVECDIHPEAAAVHGITPDMLKAEGVDPNHMLTRFFDLVERASVVVGYSTSFDLRLMRIQAARHTGIKWDCPKPRFDVMFAAGKRMGKVKPKLTDAVPALLGRSHDGAHRALPDCQATRELYFLTRGDMEPLAPKDRAQNPRAVIGGNMPPEEPAPVDDGLTPFERIKKEIDDLVEEAKNFLDGIQIETKGQADEIGRLRGLLQDAAKRAEKLRKEEVDPLNKAKDAIQARYNPLIQDKKGIVDVTIATCNAALAPYLKRIDDEQRAAAAEAQRIANEAAYEASRAAQEAAKSTNLEQRQSAEQMLAEAKDLLGQAKKADQAKPQVGGLTRSIGLKSVWRPVMKDPTAAIEYFRAHHPAELKLWMQDQAEKLVRAGKRDSDAGPGIPGFQILEEKVPC